MLAQPTHLDPFFEISTIPFAWNKKHPDLVPSDCVKTDFRTACKQRMASFRPA